MLEFAKDFPQVNLAVSLHAPNDTIRNKIMPINKRYPLEELLAASRTYVAKTGRRITFEYALVKGINDGEQNAKELAERLRGINCHVNLIPLNQVKETGLHGTERKESELFREVLERHGIQVTIRRELGSDIDAACGQLRLKSITN
jgi:23S rRNA (adenine2503-C2)-methyltransferase